MASPSQGVDGVSTGQVRPSTTRGDFNELSFIIAQALARMQTSTLVRIESCTNDGGLSPVGLVDVTPLVNQIDGAGNPTPHATIYNVPYMRVQGGANAIVIDPEPGDIGICLFASRDITKIKSTKAQGNPGSLRQYSFSDGMYVGGTLNGTPAQYIQFNGDGIKIFSPTAIKLEAPDVQIIAETVAIDASTSTTITTPTFTVNGATMLNGPLTQGTGSGGGSATMQGPLSVTNDVTVQGTSVHTHVHGGTQPGAGTTGTPV